MTINLSGLQIKANVFDGGNYCEDHEGGIIMHAYLKFISDFFKKCQRSLEMRKYDNFTIAEYFRKQGAQIGEGCYIVPRTLGTEPYLVRIGNNVAITEGVGLHTHDGGTWVFRREMPDIRVFGPIIIEDNCLIGSNAQILPNVTIGHDSIIGVGSVVINDVLPNSIVMGVPARPLGSVAKYKEKCMQRWEEQRPIGFEYNYLDHYERLSCKNALLEDIRCHLMKVFQQKLQ